MCIICVSDKGQRQPTKKELQAMWNRNRDGAGYMYARDGRVNIHKGFMTFTEFYRNVREEKFTSDDVVIYHFRIATQAGVNPYMTHPFPLTEKLTMTRALDLKCSMGVAHNGVIQLTSDGDTEFSDTAKFIVEYMTRIIRDSADIRDKATLTILSELTASRLAIMDSSGYVALVGKWIEDKGLLFSNTSYKTPAYEPYWELQWEM